MDAGDTVDNFDFDNNLVGDNSVNPVAAVQSKSLVDQRQRLLQDKRNLSNLKFTTQTLDICGFEQSRTKCSMNLNGAANDSLCQFVNCHPQTIMLEKVNRPRRHRV